MLPCLQQWYMALMHLQQRHMFDSLLAVSRELGAWKVSTYHSPELPGMLGQLAEQQYTQQHEQKQQQSASTVLLSDSHHRPTSGTKTPGISPLGASRCFPAWLLEVSLSHFS